VIVTVGLALAGALIYGIADFLGGFASRRARAVTVAAGAAMAGLLPLGIGLAVFGGTFSGGAILWGTAAGISGSVGVLLLYAALAVGPMSVLSPLTAVVAAAVPVLVTLLSGTALSPVKIPSLVVALVAVILVSTSREKSSQPLTRRGLLAAIVAGCGFGGLVIAYDQAPVAGMATLVVARLIQVVLMLFAACVVFIWMRRAGPPVDEAAADSQGSRRSTGERWRFTAFVVTCGILDAGANVLIQTALQATDSPTGLAVVGVLNSLYPLGTVLLAWLILRERLIRMQILGLALALAASAGLALS
jgi:drug/metabolite transporter (DMT)-like permease